MGKHQWLRLLLTAVIFGGANGALAAETQFPFDGEIILDVYPMPGSKRVPSMDIAANGSMVFEMWCSRVEGQVVVAANTITVITSAPVENQCSPERSAADAALLAALTDVASWRRQGDSILLIGPKTLRFRVPTN